jgi:hypothetical protein
MNNDDIGKINDWRKEIKPKFIKYMQEYHSEVKDNKQPFSDAAYLINDGEELKMDFGEILETKKIPDDYIEKLKTHFLVKKIKKTEASAKSHANGYEKGLNYFLEFFIKNPDIKIPILSKSNEKIKEEDRKRVLPIKKTIPPENIKTTGMATISVSDSDKNKPVKKPKKQLENRNAAINTLEEYTVLIQKYLYPIVPEFLIVFLEKSLSEITSDWFNKTIKAKLSDDPLRTVKRDNNIHGLDFLPLIKLFIDNWDIISNKYNFTTEERDIVYDMKKVRNRGAHNSKRKYKDFDDILRDFDYIHRFLKLINIEQDNILKTIKDIEKIKLEIMQKKLKSIKETDNNIEEPK